MNFDEKYFLIKHLDVFERRFGNLTNKLEAHSFSNIPLDSNELRSAFPDGALHLEYIREAESRNLVVANDAKNIYKLTLEGYEKALGYKHPIKTFLRKHWKWSVGILITIIAAMLGWIRFG